MKTKAIFFDLFETLITEFSNGRRLSNRSYDYMELLGLTKEDLKQEWRSRQQKRMIGIYRNYPAVIKDIIKRWMLRQS